HLIQLAHTTNLVWIADHDDLGCYLAVGAQAYYTPHARLGDVVHRNGKSMYDWMQIGPYVLIARGLSLGPIYIGLIMRVIAGLTIPAMSYLLLRAFFRPGWATLATIWLLCDPGAGNNTPIYHILMNLLEIARHPERAFGGKPILMQQWRIISPGVTS